MSSHSTTVVLAPFSVSIRSFELGAPPSSQSHIHQLQLIYLSRTSANEVGFQFNRARALVAASSSPCKLCTICSQLYESKLAQTQVHDEFMRLAPRLVYSRTAVNSAAMPQAIELSALVGRSKSWRLREIFIRGIKAASNLLKKRQTFRMNFLAVK